VDAKIAVQGSVSGEVLGMTGCTPRTRCGKTSEIGRRVSARLCICMRASSLKLLLLSKGSVEIANKSIALWQIWPSVFMAILMLTQNTVRLCTCCIN